ncbi:hypothetical protein G6F22_011938 [Rhizopus arrhizus]|nr:hypothetical protein G6F22_011938 [Rhizopus arrhizus]
MEIEEDESKIRGPDSSRPSSRKIYDCRKNRDFTQSKQRLSVQLLHHSGSYQEKTDSGLQNDQQLYSVPSFQDGGSTCSSRGNRKERFHMQNRFERCLCGCTTTPRLPQISYISTPEHGIPIQNSGFWNECQSTDLQQTYALCYRTFEERGYTYDLLFRRHLFTSEVRRRNEDCQFQSIKTSGGSRVYYQFKEECINAVENTTVFRLPIQHQEDVNYCATRKDQQTDQEGETSFEGRLQLQLQVDSKSIGEDDFHVTSDSRRLVTYPTHTKGSIVHIAEQTSELGVDMPIIPCEQNGTGLVVAMGDAKEWSTDSENANKDSSIDNLHRCIGSRLGSSLKGTGDDRVLDRKRKGNFDQHEGITSNLFWTKTPRTKIQRINDQGIHGQYDSTKIYGQGWRNSFSFTTRSGSEYTGPFV